MPADDLRAQYPAKLANELTTVTFYAVPGRDEQPRATGLARVLVRADVDVAGREEAPTEDCAKSVALQNCIDTAAAEKV